MVELLCRVNYQEKYFFTVCMDVIVWLKLNALTVCLTSRLITNESRFCTPVMLSAKFVYKF